MTSGPCQSDGVDPQVVTNPPGLSTIAYRVSDFTGFRRALLTPLTGETALAGWNPAPGDLGLQVLEWWAYLADILTFYNERIANESYLATAELPTSVADLVALLGYQPRPAIAATGQVAALRTTARLAEALAIPASMAIASTATPDVPAQTFETTAAQYPGLSDVGVVLPPLPALLQTDTDVPTAVGSVLLQGKISSLKPGDELLVVSRTWSASEHYWAKVSVVSTTPEPDPNGTANTRLALEAAQPTRVQDWMSNAVASDYRLLRSTQAAALWTQSNDQAITASADSELTVTLSSVVRGISPGDLVFLDADAGTAVGLVTGVHEKFGSVPYPNPPSAKTPDIPLACTVLTLLTPYADDVAYILSDATGVAVRFGLLDVGTLISTPATALTSLPTKVAVPAGFTVGAKGVAAFLEDATGAGLAVMATTNDDGTLSLAATAETATTFSLSAPLRLLVDLVAVSRGTTVTSELLGTGDASVAGQSFTLKQSPLTYLASGASWTSTLQISVDGIYWTEASTFYGQPPDAAIFVASSLPDASTQIRFGDGVNGSRLPTGSTVVATYRYGAGAAAPPAGRLTTILKPQPNLAAIHNPIPVGGGSDAEQPSDVRVNAPASVLTFGRAISGDDYETVARLAPGVSRARAYWTWDEASQRTLVKVYVGDDNNALRSADQALAGSEDPNKPIKVTLATSISLALTCTLSISPDRVASSVVNAASASLSDLFSAANMMIGQFLYTSEIEAALMVDGAEAITRLSVTTNGREIFHRKLISWADPGEGGFFLLEASTIVPKVDRG